MDRASRRPCAVRKCMALCISARLLLAEGYPADTMVEVWRPNTDEWALRGRLGAVAATVMDGETAKRAAKNRVPTRFPGIAAPPPPAGDAS